MQYCRGIEREVLHCREEEKEKGQRWRCAPFSLGGGGLDGGTGSLAGSDGDCQ